MNGAPGSNNAPRPPGGQPRPGRKRKPGYRIGFRRLTEGSEWAFIRGQTDAAMHRVSADWHAFPD